MTFQAYARKKAFQILLVGSLAMARSVSPLGAGTVNYARQATVSAESTFPEYSVLSIKDGSRNTQVGPAFSWANNFPAGGKLPESVFFNFTSLKTIDRVDIYTSSGYELQNYTIQLPYNFDSGMGSRWLV